MGAMRCNHIFLYLKVLTTIASTSPFQAARKKKNNTDPRYYKSLNPSVRPIFLWSAFPVYLLKEKQLMSSPGQDDNNLDCTIKELFWLCGDFCLYLIDPTICEC